MLAAIRGDVRLRTVGLGLASTVPRARPTREEAAILLGARRPLRLRLRAQGPAGGLGFPPVHGSGCAVAVSPVRVRALPLLDFSGRAQAPPSALRGPEWQSPLRPPILGSDRDRAWPAVAARRRGCEGAVRRSSQGLGEAPADLRRSAWDVPVRRLGLLAGGGVDAGGQRRAGEDVHHPL